MIDCENEVYTRLAKILREKFPKIDIASEYVGSSLLISISKRVRSTDLPDCWDPAEANVSVLFSVPTVSLAVQ